MLTGIEIAGIVLATLPLVITAIQERETGIRALDALIFTKSKRNKDLEILSDQRLRFRHFCSRLLLEVGVENVADYLDVDQRTQSMWAQPEFKKRFLRRLEGSYANFDRRMHEVKKRVTRIDEYTKTSYVSFVMNSSANRKDVLQLRECIDMLREFAIDLPYVQHRSSVGDQIPAKLDMLNSRARDLHLGIRELWGCECKIDHKLYVKVSSEVENESLSLIFVSDGEHKKSGFVHQQWTWQWSVLERSKLQAKGGELQRYKSLCERLASFASEKSGTRQHISSLNVVEPPLQLFTDIDQPSDASLITLRQELAQREGDIHCVNLAILLLTGLLRYHWTPWLPELWTSEDIYFVGRGTTLSRSALKSPLLRSSFQDNLSTNEESTSNAISNEMFFEVGVMLLEIVHGDSLFSLMTERERTGAAQDDHEDRLMWRTRAAWRLFKEIPAYMCLKGYREVTERCLKNQFVDDVGKDLSNLKFRGAVYAKAVKPLLNDLARVA
ncbi:hypothetical protein BKA64DRAFT_718219 [Cadophora sp. MPI-SDFR-AT-0126]|nr:hypothetical protein BKA64DRAFT_718219 [Leotiomycetes sp. MPI-SDFR-AT-0126]